MGKKMMGQCQSTGDSEIDIKAKQLVDLYTSSLLNAAALKMKFDDLQGAHKCILNFKLCHDQPKYPPVRIYPQGGTV